MWINMIYHDEIVEEINSIKFLNFKTKNTLNFFKVFYYQICAKKIAQLNEITK